MTEGAKRLSALLTRDVLEAFAWGHSFERGQDYAEAGLVRNLRATETGIMAKVTGTHTSRVKLTAEDGEIDHDCTCPVGMDGLFCKHCVAVGLTWLAGHGAAAEGAEQEPGGGDLRSYLRELDKEELISLLLERAEEDDRLYRRLETKSARATKAGPDLAVYRGAFDDALDTGGFVAYGEMYDYSSGLEEVVDSVADLLADGLAPAAMELAEYGLDGVEQAMEYLDDSDGWMGGLLERLQDLHLEACTEARPDPVELAGRLFEAQLESGFGVFHRAAESYKDVLGASGLAEYRRLVEAEWVKVPSLGPDEEDEDYYGSRLSITSLMESLARVDGDLDELVAVKSRDLSGPHGFQEIALVYQDSGHPDQALDWAERGLRAFPGHWGTSPLRELVAETYHEQGRHDEAMALAWEAFAENSALAMYRMLEKHAGKASSWRPHWRDKALAHIRTGLDEEPPAPSGKHTIWRLPPADGTVLVEIFLYEEDVATAWREAQSRGCASRLWLELAGRREKTHPADAIAIYRKHVDDLLRQTGNPVYEQAVNYLDKIRNLHQGADGKAAFQAYLQDLRNTQKRKRNLMKMLDGKGW